MESKNAPKSPELLARAARGLLLALELACEAGGLGLVIVYGDVLLRGAEPVPIMPPIVPFIAAGAATLGTATRGAPGSTPKRCVRASATPRSSAFKWARKAGAPGRG